MNQPIAKSFPSGPDGPSRLRRALRVGFVVLVGLGGLVHPGSARAVTTQKDAVRLLIARWTRVLERKPGDLEAQRELADAYLTSDAPSDRIEGYRINLRLSPGDHESRYELGEAYLEAGRMGEAAKVFQELIGLGRLPVKARIGLARVNEELKRPREALTLYLAAWSRAKDHRELPLAIADVHAWLGNWAQALEFYERARALDPSDAEIPKKMEQARLEWEKEKRDARGDGEDAQEDLDVETRIDSLLAGLVESPGDGKLRAELARCFLEAHRPAEAHQEYVELLAQPTHRLEALLGLGKVYLEVAAPHKARIYFEKALGVKRDEVRAHVGLGRVSLDLDELEKARMHLAEALRLAPTSPEVLLAIGLFRIRSGNPKGAREALARVLELDDENGEARVALARLDWEAGNAGEAKKLLARVFADDPRDYEALRLRADLAAREKDLAGEAQAMEKAIGAYGFDVADYVRLGRLLLGLGRGREAMRVFLAGYRVDPDDPALVGELVERVVETPESARDREMELLLKEKQAWLMIRDGDDDRAVDALEGLKVLYEAQLDACRRRGDAARRGNDPAGLKQALRDELRLTRGKLRLHRTLAEYHVDRGQDEALERELRSIVALDPKAAPYLIQLADLYFDRGRYAWARKVYERLPESARTTLPERIRQAEAAQYSGRKKNAFRRFTWLRQKDFPDDVVEGTLGDHYAERGNHLRALFHYEKALALNSGNAEAANALRWEALSMRPDLEYALERYDDTDGLSKSDKTLRLRRRLNEREIVSVEATRFRIADRWAELEGWGYSLGYERRMNEISDVAVRISAEPFTDSGEIVYEFWGRNYPSGHVEWEWSLFNRGFGETALAARNGLTHRGFGLSGAYYLSPRLRFLGRLEQGRISDGNGRSMVEGHLQTRIGLVPGWVGLRERKLDFDFPVAPALYWAPDSLDRTDLTFDWGVSSGNGASFDLSYVYGKEGDSNTRHDFETEFTMEIDSRRQLNLRYAHSSLERSHHSLAAGFESDEYAFSYRMLF